MTLNELHEQKKLEHGLYYVQYNDNRLGIAKLVVTPDTYEFNNNTRLDEHIKEILYKVPSCLEFLEIMSSIRKIKLIERSFR